MIPLRDDNPSKHFPFVTVTIIAVNVLVFLFQLLVDASGPGQLDNFIMTWAVVPYDITHNPSFHALLTLFTSMFMHGGWLHIGGNMLYLWIFGDNVEDLLGPNILCWNTSFFIKEPHDPGFVSWHQDATYWGLSSSDVVTAWIAMSPANKVSGCMKFIPGTHKEQVKHADTFDQNNLLTRGQEIAVDVDEN